MVEQDEKIDVDLILREKEVVTDIFKQLRKKYSDFTLSKLKMKILYVVICVVYVFLIIPIICIILNMNDLFFFIVLISLATLVVVLNYIYVKYLDKNMHFFEKKRFEFVKERFKYFSLPTLEHIYDSIPNTNNIDLNFGIIIALVSVMILPLWDNFVSLFFLKHIEDQSFNKQIKSLILLLIILAVVIFVLFAVYKIFVSLCYRYSDFRYYKKIKKYINLIIKEKEG